MYIYCNTLYIYYIYIYNCNYWWYLASISGDFQKYVLQYQWITGDIYCTAITGLFDRSTSLFYRWVFASVIVMLGESWRPKKKDDYDMI